MLIIRYKGGLGNQMFQYAMQLALMKHYPEEQILADISHYMLLNEHNGYELDKVWHINQTYASKKQIKEISPYYCPGWFSMNAPGYIKSKIANNLQYQYKERKLKKCNEIKKKYYKQNTHCSYEEKVFELHSDEDWYLDGLWQNIKYWDKNGIKEDIRSAFRYDFQFRYSEQDMKWKSMICNSNSISIHVRRGDFLNSKFDICNQEYYRTAMNQMLMDLSVKNDADNIIYFIFTDDIEYVANAFRHIDNKEIVHHDVKNCMLDMELMSLCKHHIISNSTFAWWAAWLDEKQEAITIGPKYSIKKQKEEYLITAPEHWILLEV